MKHKAVSRMDPKIWLIGVIALAVLALWALGEQKDMEEREDGEAMDYAGTVAHYEGRHFQFDVYCQPTPKQATLKNGTSILLDNNSDDSRSVKLGNDTYLLAGHDWRVVTVWSPTLPATVYMDCGSIKSAGTIFLER